MNPKIVQVLTEFNSLTCKLALFGAGDSEPDRQFHRIIAAAVEGRQIDWTKVDWELYTSVRGHAGAARQLNLKAQKVYNHIRKYAKVEDLEKLRVFAWRYS